MSNKLLQFLGITRRAGNLVFGMDEVKKNCSKNFIEVILLTSDISSKSKQNICIVAQENNVPIIHIPQTKSQIESSVGKYAGIIGIKDENFANKIKTLVSD